MEPSSRDWADSGQFSSSRVAGASRAGSVEEPSLAGSGHPYLPGTASLVQEIDSKSVPG